MLLFAGLLFIATRASAQLSWNVTYTNEDSSYYYSFTSISCIRNICTVASIATNKNTLLRTVIFFRSIDGGLMWERQDPGLRRRKESQDNFTSIEQIDSLHAIATGADSGLIVSTSDGGKTWLRRDCKTSSRMTDIFFSDTLIGIAISSDSNQIHITSDGGKSWIEPLFQKNGISQCYSYGKGRFRVFDRSNSIIYTTDDNWNTVDSTKPIFSSMPDSIRIRLNPTNCNFTSSDTILAFGNYFPPDNSQEIGLIVRSTNGGTSWEPPIFIPFTRWIEYSTLLNRDTIYAGGVTDGSFVISTDKGVSWRRDKIILDTNIFLFPSITGIALANETIPIMTISETDVDGSTGAIVRGFYSPARVESYERIIYNTHVYPNPTFSDLNIISIDALRPIYIFDMLGREVMQGKTNDQGKLTLDVSKLPPGIYVVQLNHFGKMLPIGKVSILSRY